MSITSIAEMRKNRSSIDDLLKAAESTKKTYDNDKVETWSCQGDKMGNGSAVIRFLQAPVGESVPWAKIWTHGFKNEQNGRWYIENSRTTLGEADPMQEFNNSLYATKDEAKIKQAKEQKRKLSYYANILVVKDPANPENEGKVFLFRFGQKIFDKIMLAMKPDNTGLEPEDWSQPIDPFSFFDGANFNLKMEKVAGFANFDKSNFGKQKPVAATDEEIESIWKQCQSLTAIVAPEKFKSFEELSKKINWVFGSAPVSAPTTASSIADQLESDSGINSKVSPDTSGDDADLDYFRKLSQD